MRWSMGMAVLALGAVSGCIGFNDDFSGDFGGGFEDGGFDSFNPVAVAERTLKVNLDEGNPVQRFVVQIEVSPFAGDASVTVSVVTASDTAISGDLNPVDFGSNNVDDWFSFGPGIPLQSFLFESPQDFVLGLGTYTPPVSVELKLTLMAPPDGDFDGRPDDVIGTIGDLRLAR